MKINKLFYTLFASIMLVACTGTTHGIVGEYTESTEIIPESIVIETPIVEVTPTATSTPTPLPEPGNLTESLDSSIPVTGNDVPQLAVFDQAILEFMEERQITAAQLVIVYKGKIVLEHAYGWFDQAKTQPFTNEGVMRIASVTKPFTKAAIKILIDEGKLSLDQTVFCLNGAPANCILTIEPINGVNIDERMGEITVGMLLDHKGGFDREASFDPMFASIKISKALGVQSPPSKEQIVQYMLGQPLDFNPGAKEVYSNYGYLLLGLIIEKVSGMSYLDYLYQTILTPMGIDNVTLGATLPENRLPNEPYYISSGKGENVYAPGTFVTWADGGWCIENMAAHGGIVTNADTLAKFISLYCINTGKLAGGFGWCNSTHFFGSLDGTLSLVSQDNSKIHYSVIFNKRWDETNGDYTNIRDILNQTIYDVEEWPE